MGRTRTNYHHGEGRYHIAISQIQVLTGTVFGSRRLDAMAFGFYFSLTYLVDRTIFDECAFSNPFQCRDLHVATWMHMTSRLNPTRGSQLVAKQWRRCALGDLGPGGHTTILARGHTSHFLGVQGQSTILLVLLGILVSLLPVS